MRPLIRLTHILPLLVTFLVVGLLPAAGSWSCPDGTACVYTRGRGYHCLGDRCRMPCCVAKKSAHCCGCCGHGAGPGAALAPASAHGYTIGQPARCRYYRAQQVEIAWVRPHASPTLQWHAVAGLPAPIELPAVVRSWVRLAPIRGSPPAAHAPPASSPRAPPGPYCA